MGSVRERRQRSGPGPLSTSHGHGSAPAKHDCWAALQSSVGNKAVSRFFDGDSLSETLADAMKAARAVGAISSDLLGAMAAIQSQRTVKQMVGQAVLMGSGPGLFAAALAAQAGNVSEIELTDVVFKIRHPDRATRKLVPGDPTDAGLIKEWVDIRRSMIRPMLSKMGLGGGGGGGGGKGESGKAVLGSIGRGIGEALGGARKKASAVPDMAQQILEGLAAFEQVVGVRRLIERMGDQLNSERMIVIALVSRGVHDEKVLTHVIYTTRHPVRRAWDKATKAEWRAIRAVVVRPAVGWYTAHAIAQMLRGFPSGP